MRKLKNSLFWNNVRISWLGCFQIILVFRLPDAEINEINLLTHFFYPFDHRCFLTGLANLHLRHSYIKPINFYIF